MTTDQASALGMVIVGLPIGIVIVAIVADVAARLVGYIRETLGAKNG